MKFSVGGQPVPTHETEFARDSVFGYTTSFLPDYVAEKTGGRIPARDVRVLTLAALRAGDAVVQTPADHRLPRMPVVIFPGNVGGDDALAEAYRRLSTR